MKTREEYVAKFKKFGIEAKKEQIYSSAYLAAVYLARDQKRRNVFCFGSGAMRKEMDAMNIECFGFENEYGLNKIDIELWTQFKLASDVSHVLCGFDPNFNFTKVCQAASYLNQGATFIVTNMDETLPLDKSELCLPDVGAMVASVSTATKRHVDLVCGKPSTLAFELITAQNDQIKAESSVMFGDRLDTDIEFGKACQMMTVLTMTGITTEQLLAESTTQPDYIIQTFVELL